MKIKSPKKILSGINLPLVTVFNFLHLSSIQVSNALLQLLLFPIIFRVIGITEFGYVGVANSFATLMGIVINYGTNQSGIKEIALHRNDPVVLSEKFFRIFSTRVILFLASLLVLPCLKWFGIANFHYYLFAYTLILAEVINPIFFFIGVEKLLPFNIANLSSKIISILLIIFLIKGSSDSYLVNFYLGLSNLLIYLPLTFYATARYHLQFSIPPVKTVWDFIKENFSLFINNVSVQLQQSVFLFAVSSTGNGMILGAYALCDKIIWAFRLLIISFSGAIYPRCTILFHKDYSKWLFYKKTINRSLIILFLFSALVFLFFPSLIVHLFTGKDNKLSSTYMRAIAFVPLIIALNAMNILELLIRNAYKAIFYISVTILLFAVIISTLFRVFDQSATFAFYPLCIETACLFLYRYYLRRETVFPAQTHPA